MTKNIRYRGAVQSVAEYNQEVEAHRTVADRAYSGSYRGAEFEHSQGADAASHESAQHEVEVSYRGAKTTTIVG